MTLWKVEQNLGNWTFKLRFKMAKYANRMNIKRNGIKEGICISFFEIVHSCFVNSQCQHFFLIFANMLILVRIIGISKNKVYLNVHHRKIVE